MTKTYNKLVRDLIPEIIRSNGHQCDTRVLSNEEYLTELKKKLKEEVDEFTDDTSLEELADVLEVVQSLAYAIGSDCVSLERTRSKKESERGGFKDRIFLKTVEEA